MEAIRGVDVAGPLEKLLDRGLVRVVGRKDTIGHPMVYGTTDEFLRMFGLNKVSELPDLQVFAAKAVFKSFGQVGGHLNRHVALKRQGVIHYHLYGVVR